MTILQRLTLFIIVTVPALYTNAQPVPEKQLDALAQQLPSGYLDKVSSKANQLEQKLDKKSEKALRQMMKIEAGIKKKLDSLKVKEIFGNEEQKYKELEQRLQGKLSGPYISSLDTMITSIKFLQQNPQLLSQTKEAQQKVKDALSKVNGLENQFQKTEEIKRFLKERKQFLREKLSQLGFARELKKINKNIFYFGEQVKEYSSLLKEHRKAEREALKLLSKTKWFKEFFQKNSYLAGLFRLPGDPNDPSAQASLAGLQTRSMVNNLIQQQLGAGGPNAMDQFRQNLSDAQNQLSQLKEKVNQFGGGSSDDIMPEGFKKNNQRVKSFWKKWELSTSVQSMKANNFFPVSSDLSLMAGFRPRDGYIVGLGFGGLIGWGKDIRHIAISYQGLTAKFFTEIKMKGSFHFAAGYELNYRNEIRNIAQLRDYSAFQKLGLVGISKVVDVRSKLFKKTKLQLLWDWLSYQQVPRGQSVIFRVGYNF